MTKRTSPLRSVKQTVLTFDICSSSDILEDLIRTENTKSWRDLLIWTKRYLINNSDEFNFELYKFTGDGWILLFENGCSGKDLFDFMEDFSELFDSKVTKLADDFLESPPDILGLTFGIDRGTLIKFVLADNTEYIGRPINVACRLQSSIKDKDKKPQYKVLMTKSVYSKIRKDIRNYKPQNVTRKLHNIAGNKVFNCVKVSIPI